MEHLKQIKKETWFLIAPMLYTIEVILGFNGKLILIFGVPIRIILFILTFFSLYTLWYQHSTKGVKGFWGKCKKIWGGFTLLDYGILFFLCFNFFWATAVPLLFGGSVRLGLKEVNGMVNLFLFFPTSYLLKQNIFSWEKYKHKVLWCFTIFAGIHLVFYFGDRMYPGFMEQVFDFFLTILPGQGVRPNIIRGNGYARVIFSSSVLLLFGFYLLIPKLRKLSWRYISVFLFFVLALLVTLTKSLMLGAGIAAIFFVCYLVFVVLDFSLIKNAGIVVLLCGIFIFLCNYFIFDDLVFQRMSNIYILDQSQIALQDLTPVQQDEIQGSVEGNLIRIEQTKDLLAKFKEKPITGFGYGSYVAHNIRGNLGYEYLYEVFLPSLLMKIGILGMLAWMAFGATILFYIYQQVNFRHPKVPVILSGFCVLAVVTQTNPLIFGFGAMYSLLLLFLEIEVLVGQENLKKIENKQRDTPKILCD